MLLNEQLSNNLSQHTKVSLLSGQFLFLDKKGQPVAIPYSFEIFQAFVIYAKNFNSENVDYIKQLYDRYCDIIKK